MPNKWPSFVSEANSTTTPLAGDAVFTGEKEDVSDYASISVFVATDVASATKGLSLELSTNGTNWDRAKTITMAPNANQTAFGGVHMLGVVSQYFRVAYTNGSGAQAYLRIQTVFHTSRAPEVVSTLDQDINDQADVQLVRAALMGETGSGLFTNVDATPDGDLHVAVHEPTTAFGELWTESAVPRVQIDAIYGLLDSDHETFTATGGSATASGSLFVCSSGTSVGGYGVVRSKRNIGYRPGQGASARFTALFDSDAVANSQQLAGLGVAENGLYFGYNGTSFGVARMTGGALEIQTLTITAADSTGGTAVVTLDGTGTNVTLTGGGTVQDDAAEIAATAFTGWGARQVDDTVIFLNVVGVGDKTGAFTYAAPVDGTGTFAETQAGAANTETWTAQTAWNIDTMDGGADSANRSGMTLDVAKLNVYQIDFQWLGAGAITFSVENPATGRLTEVHREQYANNNTTPSLLDPSMKLSWASASLGSSGTDLVVKGASGAGFVQGNVHPRRNPRAVSNDKTGIGTSFTNVLTLRVGLTFNGKTSQREMLPLVASCAVDGTKVSDMAIFLNATLGGTTNYQYIDEGQSIVEWDIAGTTVTGGEVVAARSLGKVGEADIDLRTLDLHVEAGDWLTIAVKTASTTTDADCTVTWQEDD